MPRLQAVDPATASGVAKDLLDTVNRKMGRVPNVFAHMAASPVALEAFLAFSGALAKGTLDAKLRELIAIAVAETNGCQYCLSAHMALGKNAGLSENELKKARDTQSDNPKYDAALTFVRNLMLRQRDITDGDVNVVKEAGFTDGEIAEIIANVSLNIYTNYFNLVVEPEIDFPKVELAFPA